MNVLCVRFVYLSLALAAATAHASKKPQTTPVDVLQRVNHAHAVFVSNGGDDVNFGRMRHAAGGAYRTLYDALKAWGKFQMVDSPSKADLVFQIRGTEKLEEDDPQLDVGESLQNNPSSYSHDARLELWLLDPTSGIALWYTDTKMGLSFTQSGMDKDFAKAVATMLAGLQYPKSPEEWRAAAPLPGGVLHAKKILLDPSPDEATLSETQEAIYRPLMASGMYQVVRKPEQADLIVRLGYANPADFTQRRGFVVATGSTQQLIITLLDPSTKISLWGFSVPIVHYGKQTREQGLQKAGETIVETLNSFISNPPK